MVLDVGAVIVVAGGFDVGVRLDVPLPVGVCVGAAVEIDVDVLVSTDVDVGVAPTVQVMINCGDWVILFSWV